MTTPNTTGFRLPDPPERGGDEFTRARHLFMTGSAHHLVRHLGSPETTLVSADLYITQVPRSRQDGRMPGPDLLVAFDVDPELYYQNNGYVISEQGKPPDFVLEDASCEHGRGRPGAEARRLRCIRHTGILALRRDLNRGSLDCL